MSVLYGFYRINAEGVRVWKLAFLVRLRSVHYGPPLLSPKYGVTRTKRTSKGTLIQRTTQREGKMELRPVSLTGYRNILSRAAVGIDKSTTAIIKVLWQPEWG